MMSLRSAPIPALLILCASCIVHLAPARAQIPALPSTEDKVATEASVERAELEKRRRELRERISEWETMAAEFTRAGQDAQARTERLDQEISLLQKRDEITVSEEIGAAELDAALLEAEQDLAAARAEAKELDTQAGQRTERRRRLPELLALARQRLKDLDDQTPAIGADAATAPMLSEIEELRRRALQAEIDAYQAELASYDVRGTLLAKRRDRATLRIAYYEVLSRRLREAKQRLQRRIVEQEGKSAEQLLEELTAVPPGVKETLRGIHERNEALASVWTSEGGLSDQIEDVSEKLARAHTRVSEVQMELNRLAARVEAVGLADSVGALLRRHRAEAPDIGMYRRFIRMRQEQIGAVQLQQIRLREQRESLADINALVDEVIASSEEPIPADRVEVLEDLLRQLFETQRRYMDALIDQYETYFQKLVDFDAEQQQLIDSTKDLLDFIDERILWIPSGRAIEVDLLADGRAGIGWLAGPKFLAQLGRSIRDTATRWWPLHLLALVLLLLFVPFSRWAPKRLRALADEARSESCVQFAPTLEALGLSVLLAAWLPTLVAYVGWRLGQSPTATQYTRSIAYGLQLAALAWATFRLPRQLVRPRGVARVHCGWPEDAAHALWRDLRWLTLIAVPSVFFIYVFEMRAEDAWRESIGRAFFVVVLIAITVFNHFAFRNGGSIYQILPRIGKHRWSWRTAHVASIVVPLLLLVAALRGFYWTALQFTARIHVTLLFLFLLVAGMYLAARLSLVGERRAQAEDERLEEKPSGPTPTPVLKVTRLMLGTGLLLGVLGAFGIWADLLPAARILEQVELWSTTQTVTVTEVDPAGLERASSQDQIVAITLADLLRGLLIGLLTLTLVRALPGLLEVTLFRRLGPGERYAYVTIVKYGVVLAGLALAFDSIGVGWSSIQWLVAAIGLGLGFGLQEIFANFVSGLIILFERPIRVGDTVSVGNINGTVSKIRIRATWITGFDRKELIVPNKTFVTGQLVNWTLSDPILRLEIPVGIAYGSDTDRAVEVLERVAKDSVLVLHDPPPRVFFLSFGDSSLLFELRVFTRGVDQRFRARHELHMDIDRAFREAGIEIAFPQRDLHVRSIPDALRPPREPKS